MMFSRVDHQRRIAFFGMGNKDVNLAHLYASVAAITYLPIERQRF